MESWRVPVARTSVLLLCSFPFLLGCEVPEELYIYRANTLLSTKSNDLFECELFASQNVPVNTQIATNPSFNLPIQTSCYGNSCYTTGGQTVGGGTYSYDANENLRTEFHDRCMAQRRYSAAILPLCPSNISISTSLQLKLNDEVRLPQEGSCMVGVTSRVSNLIYADEIQTAGP